MSTELVVDVTTVGDRACLVVTGDIDVETVAGLDKALASLDLDWVTVDLSRVTFCDSRALECLIRHRVVFRDRGRRLEIADPSPVVDRLLKVTGMDRFFEDD